MNEDRLKVLLKNIINDMKEKIFEEDNNMEQFIPYLTTEIGFTLDELEELGFDALEEEYTRG